VERDNVGEHKVCPNLSCLKTCYIVNDDDESPSSPPSISTTTDRKIEFQDSAVRWIMEESIPFRAVETKSFRAMVNTVEENESEHGIFKISRSMARRKILNLGLLSKKATKLELQNYICAFPTDHWTGPNDETYTTLTCHYINEEWEYHSCVVGFKVFHGQTRGQDCGEDLFNIFDDYEFKSENVTIIVTDTTASMITFGKTIRNERKIEHGFCVDHNLHRNCILAFDDKNLPGSERR